MILSSFKIIAIVDIGYVGLVRGTCFAEMGAHAACVDEYKIQKLEDGFMPIDEPGKEEFVKGNVRFLESNLTKELKDVKGDREALFSAEN